MTTDLWHRPTEPIPLETPLSLEEIPTPALVVDVAAMERNLDRMVSFLGAKGKALRPHAKTHKCPVIARRQLERGALGVCCAKVSEAEVMAGAGVAPILITSPVVSNDKAQRVSRLAARMAADGSELQIVVDSATAASVLDHAAGEAGIELGVLIDLDVGTRRTGISHGAPAVQLARSLSRHSNLELCGLQVYAGHLMHVKGHEERRAQSLEALALAVDTQKLLAEAGFSAAILTGGGTGTFDIDCDVPAMTDLQVGSYLFMDTEYRAIGGPDGEILDAFEPSLFVLATAISQPRKGLITVDAGAKAMVYERSYPELFGIEGVRYHWAGDEHGVLELREPSRSVELGDRVRILPAHCDPTVNLHDFYYALEEGVVRELWPISARGCSQ